MQMVFAKYKLRVWHRDTANYVFVSSNHIFGITLLLTILAYSLWHFPQVPSYFLFGFFGMGAVNLIDDIFQVFFPWRLMAQFFACSFILMQLGLFYSYWAPILLVCSVAFLNAYNFMDGSNGISALYGLAVLAPLAFLGNQGAHTPYLLLSLGFLVYFAIFNVRPRALAMLGDTGAVALACIIIYACLSMFQGYRIYLFVPLSAIYLIDTGCTLVLRMLRGENVFTRHHQHLYQVLQIEARWSPLWVALAYALPQLLANVLILLTPNPWQWWLSIILVAVLTSVYLILRFSYLPRFPHRVSE
jgi:UDP-N-acetylmuramyl pentapeptide phosphotransferase/UDP-N-acetylglucosamine-1-phosphate transferase